MYKKKLLDWRQLCLSKTVQIRIFRQENAQDQIEDLYGKKGESAFKTNENSGNIGKIV